ncbi:HAD family hydrolase [Clostridium omnivorum]|uniref:Haloacid dehalogenase n=1 Tax=Clostridium omnivorum TaxID=1604902 RepID=A0ABQ5N435_9CLOT|nr:HAD family phosphatase [Clostridium sp. E14]GLC29978.1 haloacid dehalogenase [Clostridium sp. E14]
MLKNIKAAIFDMDGTLVDSMWVWSKIDIEFLKKRGIALPSDLKDNIEHLSFTDTAKYFKDRFKLQESIEDIMKEWNDMAFEEYSKNIKLKADADRFLSSLKTAGIKIALATSNSQMLLEASLKNNGVLQYFDVITTTDEVARGKNFPDIYLLTAKRLGVTSEECIVFEDILPAVKGAKAAGMKVVGVFDEYSEHQKIDIINTADYFINEYKDIIEAV